MWPKPDVITETHLKIPMIIFYTAVILWLELCFCVHTDEGRSFVAQEKQTALGSCNLLPPHPCQEHQGPVPENDVLSHTSPIPTYLQFPFSFQAPSLLTDHWWNCVCQSTNRFMPFDLLAKRPKPWKINELLAAWGPFSVSPFSNTCSYQSQSHIWLQLVSWGPKYIREENTPTARAALKQATPRAETAALWRQHEAWGFV